MAVSLGLLTACDARLSALDLADGAGSVGEERRRLADERDLPARAGRRTRAGGSEPPQDSRSGGRVAGGYLILAAILLVVYFWRDRATSSRLERTLAGVAAGTLVAYVLYYLRIGYSYQQWKFASVLSVAVDVCHAGRRLADRRALEQRRPPDPGARQARRRARRGRCLHRREPRDPCRARSESAPVERRDPQPRGDRPALRVPRYGRRDGPVGPDHDGRVLHPHEDAAHGEPQLLSARAGGARFGSRRRDRTSRRMSTATGSATTGWSPSRASAA